MVVVDRAAQPEVTAPLGWVLSDASMASMDHAMEIQQATRCGSAGGQSGSGGSGSGGSGSGGSADGRPATSGPACALGYGAMGDLIGYLTRG